MTAADPRCAMLSELSRCAYRLGLEFGRAAEEAEGLAGKLEYFRLFDRCFFSVRVATALELRLRRAPAGEALPGWDNEPGEDRADAEPSETERPERDPASDRDWGPDRDRDREREAEPASLPVLLGALNGVVADASALPGPEPAALPTLRELLAHVAADAPPATPSPTTPKTDLRARLAGSGAALTLQLTPRPAGLAGGLAVRRATGPPRR